MMPIERQRQIIEQLTDHGRVLVSELVNLCQVSQETIRRDLQTLEKKGVLQRSHGGAVIAQRSKGESASGKTDLSENELAFRQRINENVTQKMLIAKRALAFISPGDYQP